MSIRNGNETRASAVWGYGSQLRHRAMIGISTAGARNSGARNPMALPATASGGTMMAMANDRMSAALIP